MTRMTPKLLAAFLGLGLIASGQTADAQTLKLQKRQATSHGISPVGSLTAPFNTTCAPGFSKVGENKNGSSGWVDWYVCSTPVITCPKQVQKDGRVSGVNVQAIVQMVGGDPDGGLARFRVQYKCDYLYNAPPEG